MKDQDITEEIDLSGLSTAEPDVPAEASREFENAAMIGDEKLRASGFFVNIVVVRPPRPRASRTRTR